MSKWLSDEEARAYLGVSRTTLHRYRRTGKLRSYKIAGGSLTRYKQEDLDELIQPEETGATAAQDGAGGGDLSAADSNG